MPRDGIMEPVLKGIQTVSLMIGLSALKMLPIQTSNTVPANESFPASTYIFSLRCRVSEFKAVDAGRCEKGVSQ